MKIEKRKHSRIEEIGKVESHNLCLFPGVLVDVSKVGCRVRFPDTFEVDVDIDYELKISPVVTHLGTLFKLYFPPIILLPNISGFYNSIF